MRYLTVADVLRMCEAEVGPELLGDVGMPESAVSQPQATFSGADLYPDLATKAAALFRSLVRNHPFIDGNKRIAVMALDAFCILNGAELAATDADLVALALDVAEGNLNLEQVAETVKRWMGPLVPDGFDPDA